MQMTCLASSGIPLVQCSADGYSADVYLFGPIGNPEEYMSVVSLLSSSPEGADIRLHINTDGGSLDTADMLYTHIKNTAANVVAHTYGLVASAGTIIVAACPSVRLSVGSKFLVHMPSTPALEDLDERTANAWTEANRAYIRRVYSNLLDDKQIVSATAGDDVFLPYSQLIKKFKGDV